MQLEQGFDLPLPEGRAWTAFNDIALLVECLPGASLTGPAVDGEVPMRFDVKLGPIAAAFAGSGRLSLDDTARTGRFEGSASDRRTNSRVKGSAAFTVLPADGGCHVKVLVDYALTGSLAQFNRGGIVRELAAALTAQFAGNLSRRLQQDAAAATAALPSEDPGATPQSTVLPAPASTSVPAPAALDGWSLLRQILKARWSAWLDRLFGRKSS